MWRATLSWQREIRAALEPLGLTHGQFVVLAATWWLNDHGEGPPTQRQVADFAGTDPMTTSQIVQRLRAAGFLDRHHDPADKRAWRLALTPAGSQQLAFALPAVEAVDASFFKPLGDQGSHWRRLLLRLPAPSPASTGSR